MPSRLLIPALLLCSVTVLQALDVVGEAPYLQTTMRADWRGETLGKVLKDIERQGGPPVSGSPGLDRIRDTRLVTLVDAAKARLRDTLELLERTQDLHVTAEPLALHVETWEDFRDRKRHPVNLALRDYGLFVDVRDFPAPELGFGTAPSGGGGGFSLYKADTSNHAAGAGPDPEEIVGWLRSLAGDGGVDLRGSGNAYLRVTDEEEAAMRTALAGMQATVLQRTAWRVVFGTLPAGEPLPTGLVDTPRALALGARLQMPQTLTLSAMNGQRVHALHGRQQSLIEDLDIVSYQYDPKMRVITTGRAADLRPSLGMQFTRVAYQLAWVDPLPSTPSELTNPARVLPGQSSSTVETGKEEKKNQQTSVSVTQAGGDVRPGVTMTVSRPVFWTWMPRGDVLLPKERALVLATEHPIGTAVMILETQP